MNSFASLMTSPKTVNATELLYSCPWVRCLAGEEVIWEFFLESRVCYCFMSQIGRQNTYLQQHNMNTMSKSQLQMK